MLKDLIVLHVQRDNIKIKMTNLVATTKIYAMLDHTLMMMVHTSVFFAVKLISRLKMVN
jgi:hypothetical protein